VSHIPVREALRQLESEGLVDYQPNRGATVSALSGSEIREIYEIRAILETAAVRRAASRLTPAQLNRAAAMLDRAERTDDGAEWGALDVDFHEAIYALDERPRLQELITGFLRRVDRYWLSHGLMLKHRERFDREHRQLLEALVARDGDRASRLLSDHLSGASELLISALDESGVAE
jgi:DNA-binding GntR family transcriptional regulator